MRQPAREDDRGHPDQEHHDGQERPSDQQDGQRRQEKGEYVIHGK